jgi:hypothetical protein
MTEHPAIERLRELSDTKLRFVVLFAGKQLDIAKEDGDETKQEIHESILRHAQVVLMERLELGAIGALVNQYGIAEALLRETPA